MSKKEIKQKDYHYYGTTCLNWAVGQTQAEVLAKLGRMTGANTLKQQVKANGGMYVWTCIVGAPEKAHYQISNYTPQDVPWCRSREYLLQNTKGHVLPQPNVEGEPT